MSSNTQSENYQNLKISAFATIISETIMLPITTIKTVYQTSKRNSIFDTAIHIYQTRSIRGFYRSFFASVLSQTTATSIKYVIYSKIKNDDKHLWKNMLCGIFSGFVSCSIVHPINIVKQHQERGLSFLNRLKEHGPRIFYRGYCRALLLSTLLTLSFPIYDYLRTHVNNTTLAAASSSIIITTLLQPIDYLKIRGMAGKNTGLNLYRGYHINLMRSVPHFVITFSIIEFLKERYTIK